MMTIFVVERKEEGGRWRRNQYLLVKAVNEREDLIVSEDIWNKNIFVINRVTGRGKDMKMFYEFTDPSNRESFLVLNPDQNPFDVLDMNEEVPNALYRKAAGSRAKTLNNAGIHTLKK